MEFEQLIRILDAGTSVAVLGMLIYLFVGGRIISRTAVEDTITRVVAEVLDQLERRGDL